MSCRPRRWSSRSRPRWYRSGTGGAIRDARRVGNDKHLKLTLEDSSSTIRSAIGFGLGDRPVEVGAHLDLAFLPKISTYQGRHSAELEVADLDDVQAAPVVVEVQTSLLS